MDKIEELGIKGQLIENLPFEMVWVDINGNLIYANEKFRETIGYSKKECEKLSVADINVSVTQESWKNHWEEVHKTGGVRFTATHKTKGGKFYDVEVSAQSFSFKGENYICAIVNDILESSFNKKLIENTQKIANLGGWELNLQDGSIMATTDALSIFNTDDSQDLAPNKIIHRFKDGEKLRSLLGNVIRNAHSFDEIFETDDSPPKHIRTIAKPVLKGDKIYKVLGIYQDVSEQILKEKSLRLFKEIIDKSKDLIYVINLNGDLLHHSESLEKHLGYTKKELSTATIYSLEPSIDQEFWHNHLKEISQKESVNLERLLTRKDGTEFPADITANRIRYDGQDYNCAVVRDITSRKMRDLELYKALEEIKLLKDRLEEENEYLQEEIIKEINFGNIIGKSESYKGVLNQVDKVAPTDTTVLITGESGTGKELLARAVHLNSVRKNRPLIKINCATLPKELIESELFGHKKGAFTGAVADKLGKFTLADGGTIFLDEIGELPIELQSKLLRVLQEGEYDELGGTKTIKVDVRVIAATNRDLKELMREGKFREDLYYRLNVFPIHNIPLRARKDDIPLLAQYFLEKFSIIAGKNFKRLSKETIEALMNYNFPGNIRELENLIERAVIIENGPTLGPGTWMPKREFKAVTGEFKSFEEHQKDYIVAVLDYTNWRVSGQNGAAKILDMKDKTLFAKMKRLGIEKEIRLKL